MHNSGILRAPTKIANKTIGSRETHLNMLDEWICNVKKGKKSRLALCFLPFALIFSMYGIQVFFGEPEGRDYFLDLSM